MKPITPWNTFVLFVDCAGNEIYIAIKDLHTYERDVLGQMDESALYQKEVNGTVYQLVK